METEKQTMTGAASKMPFWTLAVVIGSLAASLSPDISSLFIYDRHAVLRGEIWRLLLSHTVHFGNTHLFYDALSFGLVGWMLESKGRRHWWLFYALVCVCIGGFMVIGKPMVHYYGGLSGLVCAALTYLALDGLNASGSWRVICRLILLLLPIKIALEGHTGASILPFAGSSSVVLIWESHALGCIVALSYFGAEKYMVNQSRVAKKAVSQKMLFSGGTAERLANRL